VRLGRLLPLFLLAPLALPAGAAANDFQQIFGDYKDNGQIDGCYRPHEIYNAGRAIPPDIEQYAPGFGNALSSAQSRCGSGQLPTSEPQDEEPLVSAGATPNGPNVKKRRLVAEPPAPKVGATPVSADLAAPELAAGATVSSETPGALIALLVAAGIAVALALAWTLAWFMGWNTERLTKPLSAAFQTVWDRLLPGR